MAEMTIRLRINPETGKKDIIVSLHSDDDSLPHEHEQLHRKLVEKLISGGLLTDGEAGTVVVERLEEQSTQDRIAAGPDQAERPSLSEG
ncbi:MAG: hypothetical protein SFV81_22205 [Pirellulaceae bacterium]|nr:hypothetical protein [Pirellulaceae bacterium]